MLHGTCHCGSVTWQFDGMPESVTACNCTVCRRYGTLWAYDFENEGIHDGFGAFEDLPRDGRCVGDHWF